MSLKILELELKYTEYKGIKCFWRQSSYDYYGDKCIYTYIEFVGRVREWKEHLGEFYCCPIALNNVIIHLHNTVIPKIQHKTKMQNVFDELSVLPGIGIDYQNAALRFKETSYAIKTTC